jgi:A/G-specific adenine glycosylase
MSSHHIPSIPPLRIAKPLLDWYQLNGRSLPWRETRDPYIIWISEIILQQTRVAQGIDYFIRFIKRFPDVKTLAEADEAEVLRLWQGLGYYSRARNLHAAARQVCTLFNGIFPSSPADVRSLRGIGDYTAAAICSIAFRLPVAVVDGNVFRVLSRITGIDIPIDSSAGKKFFDSLAQQELDPAHPDSYNQAIMDFGALQCVPKNPNCDSCPFTSQCAAHRSGLVSTLPVKQAHTTVSARYFNYLDIDFHGNILLVRRSRKDIWQHLYEFPLIETDAPLSWTELQLSNDFREMFAGCSFSLSATTVMPPHHLSHRTIYATIYRLSVTAISEPLSKFITVPPGEITSYPLPRLIDLYFEQRD